MVDRARVDRVKDPFTTLLDECAAGVDEVWDDGDRVVDADDFGKLGDLVDEVLGTWGVVEWHAQTRDADVWHGGEDEVGCVLGTRVDRDRVGVVVFAPLAVFVL